MKRSSVLAGTIAVWRSPSRSSPAADGPGLTATPPQTGARHAPTGGAAPGGGAQTAGAQRPNDPFFNAELSPKPAITGAVPRRRAQEPACCRPATVGAGADRAGDPGADANRVRRQRPDVRARESRLHAGRRRTGELDPVGRISVHEDVDNDGVYEKHGVFLDNLVFPRFVQPFGPNSILAMESNTDEVYRYTDTNGDGVADKKELFTTNFGRSGNVEHQQSSLFLSMDNWMYTPTTRSACAGRRRACCASRPGRTTASGASRRTATARSTSRPAKAACRPTFSFRFTTARSTCPSSSSPDCDDRWGIAGLGDFQPGTSAIRPGELTLGCAYRRRRQRRLSRRPAARRSHWRLLLRRAGRAHRPPVDAGRDRRGHAASPGLPVAARGVHPIERSVCSARSIMATAPDGTLYIVDTYRGIIQEGNWTRPGSYLRAKIDQYELAKIIRQGRIWRLRYEGMERDRTQPRMNTATAAAADRAPLAPERLVARHRAAAPDSEAGQVGRRRVARSWRAAARRSDGRVHALWTLEGLGALDAASCGN